MTNNVMRKEMAKIDGYVFDSGRGWFKGGKFCVNQERADYPNDHNACQRVINKLDEPTLRKVIILLCHGHSQNINYWSQDACVPYTHKCVAKLFKSKPLQICKAIIEAKNL